MDHAETLAAFDEQLRRAIVPGTGAERDGPVVRQVSPEPSGWSGVTWVDPAALGTEAAADAVIAAQRRHFAALGRSFEWKFYDHDGLAHLPDRLRAAGFAEGEPEAVMVAETAAVARVPEPPEGVRLVPVTDEAGIEQLVAVHGEVFGGDHRRLGRELRARLADDPEGVTSVLALAGDRPISGCRIEFLPGTDFAGLWGGGTLPEWRGRGVYRALIAYRARLAAEREVRYLYVDASEDSRPILHRLGFARLSTTVPYTSGPYTA